MGLQPGLTFLLRKRLSSRIRSWFRGLNSWRGKLAAVAGLALMGSWIASVALATSQGEPSAPERVRQLTPMVVLAIALTNVLFSKPDVGIVFPPAEVGLLFPAPVTRRQLLTYRVLSQLAATLAVSILTSFFLRQHASLWLSAFLTGFLAMWLLQLIQMAIAMLASLLESRQFQRYRKLTLLGAVLLLGWGVGQTISATGGGTATETLLAIGSSPLGSVITWPLTPLGHMLASQQLFPELLLWFSLALLVNVSCTAGLILLDCNYLEHSLQASERMASRIRRVKSGNLTGGRAGGVYRSQRLATGWRLAGVGPLCLKQLITARRSASGIVRTLIVFGIAMAIPVLASARDLNLSRQVVTLLGVMSVVFLPQMLRMDFRGDVDRIELLRTLPVPDLAVVIGQLAAPVLIASGLQLLVLVAVAAAEGAWPPLFTLAASFGLPLNILVYEIENFGFLLYPHRTPSAGMADLQSFIRHMFLTLIKMLAVVLIAGLITFPGAIVYWLSQGSQLATGCTAWLAALVGEIALLPLLVFAYRRFDASRIQPD